jgi:hypothetical protein
MLNKILSPFRGDKAAKQREVNRKRDVMSKIIHTLTSHNCEVFDQATRDHIKQWWENATDAQVVAMIAELKMSLPNDGADQILTKDGWNKTLDKDGKTEYWLNNHHPDFLIVIANNQFTIMKKGNKIVHPTSPLSELKKVLSEKKADGTLPGSITNSCL